MKKEDGLKGWKWTAHKYEIHCLLDSQKNQTVRSNRTIVDGPWKFFFACILIPAELSPYVNHTLLTLNLSTA